MGELFEREHGCERARLYYQKLRAEYGQSGWAKVAATALERCGQQGGEVDESQ